MTHKIILNNVTSEKLKQVDFDEILRLILSWIKDSNKDAEMLFVPISYCGQKGVTASINKETSNIEVYM